MWRQECQRKKVKFPKKKHTHESRPLGQASTRDSLHPVVLIKWHYSISLSWKYRLSVGLLLAVRTSSLTFWRLLTDGDKYLVPSQGLSKRSLPSAGRYSVDTLLRLSKLPYTFSKPTLLHDVPYIKEPQSQQREDKARWMIDRLLEAVE